jgi:hypothetical protein
MASTAPPLQLPPTPPTQDPAVAQYLAQLSIALQQWAATVSASQNQIQSGAFIVTFQNSQPILTVVDKDGNGLSVNGTEAIFNNVAQGGP